MGIQIVIFLAFTSVTLVFNSLVIWFAYKAFAGVTAKVTETMREVHASDSAWAWLRALESASSQAVSLTDLAKDRVSSFEPALARAQTRFEHELAHVDVRLQKVYADVEMRGTRAQAAVAIPAHSVGAVLSGVREMMEYVSGLQNGADATSKQKTQSDPAR